MDIICWRAVGVEIWAVGKLIRAVDVKLIEQYFDVEVNMKITINLLSFILSLSSIPLFFIALSSAIFITNFTHFLGTHPLNIVLGITIIAFFLGVLGLKDIREWKAMARSIFTIIFTMGFSGVLIFIIFFGRLLS